MKKIFLAVFVLISGVSLAQNDPSITNYMFTPMTMNPAFAGQKKAINALLLVREQWVGFNEAPSTQMINFDTKIDKLGGIGFSVLNEKLGFEQALSFNMIYSNKIIINDNSGLSVGGAFGMMNKSLDGSKLRYEVPVDNHGVFDKESQFAVNFDLGVLYSMKDLRVGLSSTHLLNSKGSSTIFKVPRHFYGFADYVVKASSRMDIIPSVLLKGSPVRQQVEISSLVVMDNRYWCGLAYRSGDAASLLLGLNFLDHYSFGYSYDMNIAGVKGYSSGSHEIFVRFNMMKPEKPYMFYKSPRFFN